MAFFPKLRRFVSPGSRTLASHRRRARTVGLTAAWEQLEDRVLLSAFTVNSTVDAVDAYPGDGFAKDSLGRTTLRAAIMEANAQAGDDTITLGAGVFTFTIGGQYDASAATGDLDISSNISIVGAGSDQTTIDGNQLDRVFDVGFARTFSLSGVEVTGGRADAGIENFSENYGGALRIDFNSTVTIENCLFQGNSSPRIEGTNRFGVGGAISNDGDLTILGSRFENNEASNSGGAIYQGGSSATTTIRETTFASNMARDGSAIENHEGMVIESSTFVGNRNFATTNGNGGAINNLGTLTLVNSTLSGNFSDFGAGIFNTGTATVRNSTIAENVATTTNGGGGIGNNGTLNLENTIVALNRGPNGLRDDIAGTVNSLGHNLIGDTDGASGFVASDLTNEFPRLDPLADYGGPTLTYALRPTSPAIDAANSATAPVTDQRGIARPVGSAADIGAFEYVPLPDANYDSYTATENQILHAQGSLAAVDQANDQPTHHAIRLSFGNDDWDYQQQITAGAAGVLQSIDIYISSSSDIGDSFTFSVNRGAAWQSDTPEFSTKITIEEGMILDWITIDTAAAGIELAAGEVFSIGVSRIGTSSISLGISPDDQYAGGTLWRNRSHFDVEDDFDLMFRTRMGVGAAAPSVLANDTDPEGDPISAELVSGPAHGTLTLNADGSFQYTPDLNYFGTDSFTYQATDGTTTSAPATVKIMVGFADNPPPVESLTVTISPSSVGENDGPAAAIGTVTRSGDLSEPLVVNLSSSDSSEATVPASVTILAGQASATFEITAVDDAESDGLQQVTITAAAGPFTQQLTIDQSFGTAGEAATSISTITQPPRAALAVQDDGKIVAAGADVDGRAWRLNRFNADGSLDTSFGTNGAVTTQLSTSIVRPLPHVVVIQPDGKILVGGKITTGVGTGIIARYNPDGSLDETFGTDGIASFSNGWVGDIAVMPDGKIMLAIPFNGTIYFRVARLTANGQFDTTFGTNGIRTYTSINARAHTIYALTDGGFILGGDGKVARFDGNGKLVPSFGTGGVATFGTSSDTGIYEIDVLSDGRILLGANLRDPVGGDLDFGVIRLTSDGDLDTSFSGDGMARADFYGSADLGRSMIVQPDGRIILAGYATDEFNIDHSAIVRFDADGELDPTFDGDGRYQTSLVPYDSELFFDIAFQGDKLVALGGWGDDFRVARYVIDGVVTGTATLAVTDNETPPNTAPVANDDSYSADEDGTLIIGGATTGGDPLLRYDFDESASGGADALDSGTTPATNGSFAGSATRTGNTPGADSLGALDLSATGTSYVTAGDLDEIDALTEMTLTFWVNLQADPQAGDRLISNHFAGFVDSAGSIGWELSIANNFDDGTISANRFGLRFGVSETDGNFTTTTFQNVSGFSADGQWAFVALTFDRAIVNGSTSGIVSMWSGDSDSAVAPHGITALFDRLIGGTNSGELRIGDSSIDPAGNREETPPVWLDDIRIYGRPLTQQELEAVRQQGFDQGVLTNDTDPEGDALTAELVTGPQHGTLQLNSDGTFAYTPDANYVGTDSFTYKANDGQFDSNVATVSITVHDTNDGPTAVDDTATTKEDTAVVVNVLSNDSDPEDNTLSIISVSDPAGGTATVNTDGTITYTPDENVNGLDTFTYTISDGNGGTDTATVLVTVNPVNDAPTVAVNNPLTVPEDGIATITDSLLQVTDVDDLAENITFFVTTYPDHGRLLLDGQTFYDSDTFTQEDITAGRLTYEHFGNELRSDFFHATYSDGTSSPVEVVFDINLTPTNDPPLAEDDFATAVQGAPPIVIDVLANDNDYDGDALTIISVGDPFGGSATITDSGTTVTFTPEAGFVGTTRFNYTISDGNGETNSAFVRLVVYAPAEIQGTVWDDLDGDGVQDVGEAGLENRTVYLDLNDNGTRDNTSTVELDPDDFENRTELSDILPQATLTAVDGDGNFVAPVTARDHINQSTGNNVFGHESNWGGAEDILWQTGYRELRIDFHVPVRSVSIDSAAPGRLEIYDAAGTLLGTATSDGAFDTMTLSATTDIAYAIAAGDTGYNTTLDNLRFTTTAPEPTATTDSNGNYAFTNVLPGDYFVRQELPQGFTQTAPNNDNGYFYGVYGARLYKIDAVTGDIELVGPQDPQTSIQGLAYTNSGQLFGINGAGSSDSLYEIDPETGVATLIGSTGREVGWGLAYDHETDTLFGVGRHADGTTGLVVYDRGTGVATPVGQGVSGLTGTSGVAFDAANNRVIVFDNSGNQFWAFNADTGAGTLLSSAFNPTGFGFTETDTALIMHFANASNGGQRLIAVNPHDGSFSDFLTLEDAVGTFEALEYVAGDPFAYHVEVGPGESATGIDFGNVDPGEFPVAVDDAATMGEEQGATINVLANDSDPDGDPLTVSGVSDPASGTAVINGDGTITYTPNADFNGSDSFTYTVSDGNGGTDTATVAITVDPVNDVPVAVDDIATTAEDTPVVIDVLANDTDMDGDPLEIIFVGGANGGTADVTDDGTTITFTPDANFHGTVNLQYAVGDGSIGSELAVVAITVTPVNDAPQAVDDTQSVGEDGVVTVAPFLNDHDFDGDQLTVTAVSDPDHGQVVIVSGSAINYIPDENFNGSDTFTYTVSDGNGGTDTAVVSITVDPVNDAPEFSTTSYNFSTAENSAADTVVGTVAATDVDGPSVTYAIISGNASGAFAINASTGEITVADPSKLDFETTSSFNLTVQASDGTLSDTATVTISLTDIVAPQVANVEFGYGTNRWVDSEDLAGRTAPWKITQIRMTFTQGVAVDINDLVVTGTGGVYEISGFTYDSETFTAVWTLATPVDQDRVTIALDGDNAAERSTGDEQVNTDGEFLDESDLFEALDVLLGDVDGDGGVDITDALLLRTSNTTSDRWADMNGDGTVGITDALLLRTKNGEELPD